MANENRAQNYVASSMMQTFARTLDNTIETLDPNGEKGLLNAGYRAIDSLSIEKGYPHWHAEIK